VSLGNSKSASHLARCRDYDVRVRSLGAIGDCKYAGLLERVPSRNLIEISLNRQRAGEREREREREREGHLFMPPRRRAAAAAAAASEKLT